MSVTLDKISFAIHSPSKSLPTPHRLPNHKPRLLLLQYICSSMFSIVLKQGPVVQSILSLTSSLRGQLVKCFTTLYPNKLIFLVENMREAAKASHIFFHKKFWHISVFDV